MSTYSLVQGDLEPDMVITLAAPGALASLPTATAVNLYWKKPDGTIATVPLVVVNATTGQVKRVWAIGDTALAGLHRGIVQVTGANGEIASDPNDGTHLLWWVYAP